METEKKPNYVLLILLGVGAWLLLSGKIDLGKLGNGAVTPAVVPSVDTVGASALILPAFVGPNAKEDAKVLSAVFAAMANNVRADGISARPTFTDRYQVTNLFANLGRLSFASGKLKGQYPALGPAMKTFGETKFPTKQGPLTPQDRVLLEQCLSSLSAAFAQVQ